MKTPKYTGKATEKKKNSIIERESPVSSTATDIEEPRTSDMICMK
jgi:hypothetical protein